MGLCQPFPWPLYRVCFFCLLCLPFFLRPFYSSTSSCCRQKSVAGERMQRDCSSRGAWLREGRRVRERRRRCPLPTRWWHQQRAEIELVQLRVPRSREEMRVSLRSRDAVRGAMSKYQPVFVIRRFRDGSASRVTGLRRFMLSGLNRATLPLVCKYGERAAAARPGRGG